MSRFFIRWMTTTLAMLVASHLVQGVRYSSWGGLLVASLVFGLANAFLKPILIFLSLPVLVLTLGLFTLFINTLLFYGAGKVVDGFTVENWQSAFWGSLICSLVSFFISLFQARIKATRSSGFPTPETSAPISQDSRHQQGRVIDIH